MKTIVDRIKKDTGNSSDYIFREIKIHDKTITLLFNEVLSSSDDINQYILKDISKIIDENIPIIDDYSFFFQNSLPGHNVKKIKDYKELLSSIYSGYTVIIIDNNNFLGIETKAKLDRGINDAESEKAIQGPKDAFTENFNKNLGLIRKRIKTSHLWMDEIKIGKQTNTRVGILYMENIAEESVISDIKSRLKKINIDGIIDSSYIKEMLTDKKKGFFPTMMATERPDLVSMALLEGKIALIVDNSPYVLILPCFFIDFFHTSDDYYQKQSNASFIRIIRLIAFFIAIFVPAFYIAVTTHHPDLLSLDLLINFAGQREMVPFSPLGEALLMSITFEILRESDTRMASSMGTSVSILGGLVLGDAAVSAGIVSPIMIIVVAISAISGLLFSSIEFISAIRWWRFIFLFLATFLGIYGIFLGGVFLTIHISSLDSFGKPYLAPFSPFVLREQSDAFIRTKPKKIKYRNPYLTKKNIVRGR